MIINNSWIFSKNFINLLLKDNKHDEIIMYCTLFEIMGNYYKISSIIYNWFFLKQIISYIKSKAGNKDNDKIISNLLNRLMKFSIQLVLLGDVILF